MNPRKQPRTLLITLLGVFTILAGGIGSLFSAFALLMAIGKPYANSQADPLGIFLIFILPPATLLAGIGLLLRHRWARWWLALLMFGLIALGVKGFVAPDHRNPAYAPVPGPAADALDQRVYATSAACIGVGALILLGLFSPRVRREFGKRISPAPPAFPAPPNLPPTPQEQSEGWRVGHRGRDMMFYEELHGREWLRLDIDGEMLMGRAHHVIYFANAETWRSYPEWARLRRDEIIARIKSRFREPDYEYYGAVSTPPPASAVQQQPATIRPPLSKKDGSILPAFIALLALAAGAFWLVAGAMKKGETRLPAKHARNTVTRTEDPALFWASVGTVSAVGFLCAGGAGWLLWTNRQRG
jgi:hypothetical protein